MSASSIAFASDDVDVASERLSSIYGQGLSLGALGAASAFSISLSAVQLGRLLVTEARVRGISTTVANEGFVHFVAPLAGKPIRYRCGSRSCRVSPGDPAVVGRPYETIGVSAEEASAVTLYAPVNALTEQAERLTLGFPRAFDLRDRPDLATSEDRVFKRTLKAAVENIRALDSYGLGSIAIAGYEDLLLSLAAAAWFPGVFNALGRPTADIAPAAVRRVRDYIESKAMEPIALSKVAADADIPMRTLQARFRRHFGCSPQAWLMECRLERARRLLMLPDGATAVTAVAHDCGFTNLGDFSVQYRKKFGESPSEALRVARDRLS